MAVKTTLEQEGALYDLQRLQEKADRRNTEYEYVKQQNAELGDLKTKVEQLRERRDKLRERLKHGPLEIVQEYLKMGQSSRRKYPNTLKQTVLTAARLLHKRKLADLCDAYRLTGISIVSQEAKRTCFRCETFFNCRYHEPYYVEVELRDNTLEIHKHTVPYFIPIDTISQQYLNSDIKKFFMVISEHLNAFVARREQVHLCEEQHKDRLEGEISCSPAHDFIQLKTKNVDGQDKGVVVKLTYDRLTVTRPSGVELLTEGENTSTFRRGLQAKTKLFKDLYLHQAFAESFTQDLDDSN